jgi:hypothetical protein
MRLPMSATLPGERPPSRPISWSSANLTSVAIDRDDFAPDRFQRFAWRRRPKIALALGLGLGSLVVLLVGPLAWRIASAELVAITRGQASRSGRRWIAFARLCGIVSTCALVAAFVAFLTIIAT